MTSYDCRDNVGWKTYPGLSTVRVVLILTEGWLGTCWESAPSVTEQSPCQLFSAIIPAAILKISSHTDLLQVTAFSFFFTFTERLGPGWEYHIPNKTPRFHTRSLKYKWLTALLENHVKWRVKSKENIHIPLPSNFTSVTQFWGKILDREISLFVSPVLTASYILVKNQQRSKCPVGEDK